MLSAGSTASIVLLFMLCAYIWSWQCCDYACVGTMAIMNITVDALMDYDDNEATLSIEQGGVYVVF